MGVCLSAVTRDDRGLGRCFVDTHARLHVSTVGGQTVLSRVRLLSSQTKTLACLLTWLSADPKYPGILAPPAFHLTVLWPSRSRTPWKPWAASRGARGSAPPLSPRCRRSSPPARLPVSWRSLVSRTEPVSSSPPSLWSDCCRRGVEGRRWCGGARCLRLLDPVGLSGLHAAPDDHARRRTQTRWWCLPLSLPALPLRTKAPPWCGGEYCRPSALHGSPPSYHRQLVFPLTGPSWGVASVGALHYGGAQSGGR